MNRKYREAIEDVIGGMLLFLSLALMLFIGMAILGVEYGQ